MSLKQTLKTITSGYNLANLMINFNLINDALEDAVSKVSGDVNTMNTDIDMNGNKLLNASQLSSSLSTYADNATAITGGLSTGDWYKTSTGEVRVVV